MPYTTDITRFAWDAGTPLPLYSIPTAPCYATFGNGGSLYTIEPRKPVKFQSPSGRRGLRSVTRCCQRAM